MKEKVIDRAFVNYESKIADIPASNCRRVNMFCPRELLDLFFRYLIIIADKLVARNGLYVSLATGIQILPISVYLMRISSDHLRMLRSFSACKQRKGSMIRNRRRRPSIRGCWPSTRIGFPFNSLSTEG